MGQYYQSAILTISTEIHKPDNKPAQFLQSDLDFYYQSEQPQPTGNPKPIKSHKFPEFSPIYFSTVDVTYSNQYILYTFINFKSLYLLDDHIFIYAAISLLFAYRSLIACSIYSQLSFLRGNFFYIPQLQVAITVGGMYSDSRTVMFAGLSLIDQQFLAIQFLRGLESAEVWHSKNLSSLMPFNVLNAINLYNYYESMISNLFQTLNKPNEQVKSEQQKLFEELRKFRKDPSSVVHYLRQRSKYYREINGNIYLFSENHSKKAVRIYEEQPPQNRIRELVGILEGQQPQLGQTFNVPTLSQCASKICNTIIRKLPQEVHFKPETSLLIRRQLDSSQTISFPNQVICLVSVSFNEDHAPLISLLVDDDMKDRSNRLALLNSKYKYVGISSATPENNEYLRCTIYLLTDKAYMKADDASVTGSMIRGMKPSENNRSRIKGLMDGSQSGSNIQPQRNSQVLRSRKSQSVYSQPNQYPQPSYIKSSNISNKGLNTSSQIRNKIEPIQQIEYQYQPNRSSIRK